MAEAREYFPIVQDRVRGRQFNSLFLFVTSRCNSLCRTCFYFDKLNSKDDLTTREIARISETAPPFRKLWLSGGEPFLRDELGRDRRRVRPPQRRAQRQSADQRAAAGEDLPRAWTGCSNCVPRRRSTSISRSTGCRRRTTRSAACRTTSCARWPPWREAEKRYRGVKRLRRNVLTVITRENHDEIVRARRFICSEHAEHRRALFRSGSRRGAGPVAEGDHARIGRRLTPQADAASTAITRRSFSRGCRAASGIWRRSITSGICASTTISTSSAWNRRRLGRCRARRAKHRSSSITTAASAPAKCAASSATCTITISTCAGRSLRTGMRARSRCHSEGELLVHA